MVPLQPGDGDEEDEEEDEDDDAYEAVAVNRVMMMLCGLEERSPRHPHTLSDVQGSPPPRKPSRAH